MSLEEKMKSKHVLASVLAVLATASAASSAAQSGRDTAKDAPAVVKALEEQGLQLFGEFEAPGGLRAFAGITAQGPVGVYVTPDGKHAIVGTLVDAKGQDASAAVLQRMVVEPMSKRVWAQLEESHWIAEGRANAPRVVYVFSDPNCPYCNRFWKAARRWVDSGRVQLRHILVGVIRDDSANKAAAILTAQSPIQALIRNEQSFDKGGIPPLPTVPEAAGAKLAANEQLMRRLQLQGTPGIMFRDDSGIVQSRSGMPAPEDMEVVLGPHR